MKKKKRYASTSFDDYLREELKDSEFRKHFIEEGVRFEISYQILQLRQKLGLTQIQFAKKIGTTQSHVAKMESNNTENYEVKTLMKIAEATGKELQIKFI